MKRKLTRRQRLLHWMQLPEELDPHLLAVRLIGDESLLIEQHRGILQCGAERMRFLSEQGTLLIAGTNLTIEKLTETRAMILGSIRTISFEDKS